MTGRWNSGDGTTWHSSPSGNDTSARSTQELPRPCGLGLVLGPHGLQRRWVVVLQRLIAACQLSEPPASSIDQFGVQLA